MNFRFSASVAMRWLSIAAVASFAGIAEADAAYQRGPNPTIASLEASSGPFAIGASYISSSQADGYGDATVYYPTKASQGSYGLVVMCPGITATSTLYSWLAQRVASWGFVVINIDTNSVFDFDASRAEQMAAALKQVEALSKTPGTPYYGEVDTTRTAAMGHSMGGGATLDLETQVSSLKAAVPLAPGGTGTSTINLSGIRVPTFIIGFQNDDVVPNNEFSGPYYNELSKSIDSAYLIVTGGDHLSPTSYGSASIHNYIGMMTISWLKRFVDQDTRFSPFINHATGSLVTTWKQNGSY